MGTPDLGRRKLRRASSSAAAKAAEVATPTAPKPTATAGSRHRRGARAGRWDIRPRAGSSGLGPMRSSALVGSSSAGAHTRAERSKSAAQSTSAERNRLAERRNTATAQDRPAVRTPLAVVLPLMRPRRTTPRLAPSPRRRRPARGRR